MFCTKNMRCHHLDRADQVGEYEQSLRWANESIKENLAALQAAQEKYDKSLDAVPRIESKIADLKATLHVRWIEPNDLPW